MDDQETTGSVTGGEETKELSEQAQDELEQAEVAEKLATEPNEGEAALEPSESALTRLESEESDDPDANAEAAEALEQVSDDMLPHEDGTTIEETEADGREAESQMEEVPEDQPLMAESTLAESSLESLLVTGEMQQPEAEQEQQEPVEEKPVIPPVPVSSRYGFVVLAAKRAKQLRDKAPAFVEVDSPNVLTQALKEVAEEKIYYRLAEEDSESSDS